MKFLNFLRNGTTESSMRLVFIITAVTCLTGLLFIDIKFAINLTKYSGTDISLVIAANSAFLISVIYGKNASKKAEVTNNQSTTIDASINVSPDPQLPLN